MLPPLRISDAENFITKLLKENLSPVLTYHGFHHTEDVLQAAMQIAATENISERDIYLLRMAALLHDSGFTHSYKNHEKKGCEIAREILPQFGFLPSGIDCICGMIMATKIPQKPVTQFEKIICDADLDYLGRNDFYTTGQTLYDEFKHFNIVQNEKEWNELQIYFLEHHQYHTDNSKKEREPEKQKHLSYLKKLIKP
jgi:uncharacterized protein